MAVISPNTFNALRGYVNVRLQQGVPIVDADWNELDDIRKFELRAFLKWFVGDGIPNGNDGFRVRAIAAAPPNDFVVQAGVAGQADGLTNVGRCLVDGLDVMIGADVTFSQQPLHESKGAAADALAARLGVPKIAALPTPAANGTVVVYLDVWERLVTPEDDPSLVLAGLGTESCARMKRDWVVRASNGTAPPASGTPAGHSYYALATLARRAGDGVVRDADIADLRHTRLSIGDMERRLSTLERLLLTPAFAAPNNQFNQPSGAPGTPITLFGTNFNIGTVTVRFGSVAATVVGAPGPNQVVARVPTMPAGQVKVTIETSGGSDTSDDTFTVTALPAPTFAAPNNQLNRLAGPPGITLTLFGNNFNIGTVTVRFGAVVAAIVGTPTATQITVTVPAMPAGQTTITVETGGGTATSTDLFVVTAP